MAEELKTVAKFDNAMSAHITAGMLNENGIPPQCSERTPPTSH